MLREMTIGTYYPVDSRIHRIDPRVKLIAVIVFLVSLFLFHNFTGYLLVTAFLGFVIVTSKIPIKHILKGMKTIVFLLIFTAIFNLFFTPGDVLFEWRFITITDAGIRQAIFIAMRLIYLVIGSSMLTYTTTPGELTDSIESLLGWLGFFRVPVHDFAMMMSLALRFIPILLAEANRIMDAQSARGADFESKNFIRRMKSYVAILVPLFVSAVKRAYDLGLAMESRCYRGGQGRTRLRSMEYRMSDIVAYLVIAIYFVGVIYIGRLNTLI